MKFPDALNRLLEQLHADCFVGVDDEREVARYAVEGISREDRALVAEFLDRLLSQEPDFRDLEKQWERSSADIRLGSGREIQIFFRLVREELARNR